MSLRIQKTIEVKASTAALQENRFSGAPSAMGCIDQGGDVIFPGFFRKALAGFRSEGFVPLSHQWDALPVAMPILIEERGNILYSEAEFHSIQSAQDTRTVCKERLDHNLSMGLSIGISITDDGYRWFNNGAQLLEYAKSKLSSEVYALFDEPQIKAWKGLCRALLPDGCEKLWEYSITPAPMNTRALLTDAKSQKPGTEATDPSGIPIEVKGQYLGSWVEISATASAMQRVNDAMMSKILNTLYDIVWPYFDDDIDPEEPAPTTESVVEMLIPCFDEGRDIILAFVRAILPMLLSGRDEDSAKRVQVLAELKDLRLLFAQPLGERTDGKFIEKASHLVADAEAFSLLASRRQEVRTKQGRRMSQATIDRLKAIHTHMSAGCDTLSEMIAEYDDSEAGSALPAPDSEDTNNEKAAIRNKATRLSLELNLLSFWE